MIKNYTLKQNLIVFLIILGTLFLTTFPFLIGYLIKGDDYFLGGGVGYHAGQCDINVYISYLEQAKQGHIIFSNLFTSEIQQPRYFSPLWLLLGLIAKIFQANNILIFHLARIIAGFIFLYFIFYYFFNLFFEKFFDKVIALLVLCFSSGLGIFFTKKGLDLSLFFDVKNISERYSVDFTMYEANTFITLAHSCLFILTQLFVIIIFYIFLKNNFKKLDYIYLLGLNLILGFIHPYDFFIIFGVLAAYFFLNLILLLIKKKKIIENSWLYLKKTAVLLLATLPAGYYFYFIVRKENSLWGWFKQNITLSPPLMGYLIGFGLLIILSLISALLFYKKNKNIVFLLCWIITLLIIVYLPLSFQHRFIATEHIALAILAAYSLSLFFKEMISSFNKYFAYFGIFIIFYFLSLSNLSFLTTSIYEYNHMPEYFYFPKNYLQAALWLKDHSSDQEAILASAWNGTVLPSIIARPVFFGHIHQTLDFISKRRLLNQFFQENNQDQEKNKFLREYNIDYVFYTQREKLLGDFNPDLKDYLEKVYTNPEVNIYKVKS